jgi:hypothetical protein
MPIVEISCQEYPLSFRAYKLNQTFFVLGFPSSDNSFFIFLLLVAVLLTWFKISFNRLSTSFVGPTYVSIL